MNRQTATQTHQQKPTATPSASGLLQRKCACGNHTIAGGECAECSKKKRLGLQTKLRVNEPGDAYEQEADRIADQMMAAPAHHAVSGAPPRIQRLVPQPSGQMEAAPASVEQVLASPGKPLEPGLRQDMELRFGHDFSRVRVHTGGAAEQSAREVNAHAYTVGHNMVFSAGWFAPGTHQGRRLIAHELTHVVQQSGADGVRPEQSEKHPDVSAASCQDTPTCETFRAGSSQVRSAANQYVARKTPQTTPSPRPPLTPVRGPSRPQRPERHGPGPQRPRHERPSRGEKPPRKLTREEFLAARELERLLKLEGVPRYAPEPSAQPGAGLTSEEESRLPRPFIAIATFAPGQAVMQNVKWGGWARGFSKNGTTKLGASDPEKYTFAILEPPSSVRPEGYGVIKIAISRKPTWDGYLIPVWSDLDAALVTSLNEKTDDAMLKGIPDQNIRYGNPIKGRPGNWFLAQFDYTAWVPIKNVQIKQMVPGEELKLSPEKVKEKQEEEEHKQWVDMMVRAAPAIREFQERIGQTQQPPAAPEVLRFSEVSPFAGKEVTIDHLVGYLAPRYPRGVDDPGLLTALQSSHEFSFSGSTEAQKSAAVALVTAARERERRRRRRRRRCVAPPGECPTMIRLTQAYEEWKRAYDYRARDGMPEQYDFKTNVAVLTYVKDGVEQEPIVKESGWRGHSEEQILWQLQDIDYDFDCILSLFSERKPCQTRCQPQVLPELCRLNDEVPFEVYYAVDYYDNPKGITTENNRAAVAESYLRAGFKVAPAQRQR